MATAARKARKRNGEKFVKAPKTPTPAFERFYVTESVPGAPGTRYAGVPQRRSAKKIQRFLEGRTPVPAD